MEVMRPKVYARYLQDWRSVWFNGIIPQRKMMNNPRKMHLCLLFSQNPLKKVKS